MKRSSADIIAEFGPYPDISHVHGVSYDGETVWVAAGPRLDAIDPQSGRKLRSLEVSAYAGTAYDGTHLYQIGEGRIRKIEPGSGRVVATIPAPSGENDNSGLAWAEGSLWVGQYGGRKIVQIDPESGKVLRSIDSTRFVTGVTWVDGELWHGTWEDDRSDLRRIDPESGAVLEQIDMPAGMAVSGLESDGADRFFCGGGKSGKLRTVRRPQR